MSELLFVAAVLAVAGFAKGIVGLGLPPIAMGLLVLSMPPVEAAAVMVIPALLTNVWQAVAGVHLGALLRRFWPMFALTGLATLLLAGSLGRNAGVATALLGVLLAIYAAYSLWRPATAIGQNAERWLAPASGLATGAVTAFTGVSSMPSVPFLQSVGLSRDSFVQAMGLSFTVSAIALAAGLGAAGELKGAMLPEIGLAVVAAFLGMSVGTAVRTRLDEQVFRRVFLWSLGILGLYLFLRSALFA